MKIWVDADACPKVVKDILFRAAERCCMELILVANQYVRTPPSRYIKSIQVEAGFDVADNKIAQEVQPRDLVITADIPLASAVIERGAFALNPRGQFYTTENIQGHLARRNFMDELRSSGIQTGGPSPLNQSDRQAFSNQLDRFLAKAVIEPKNRS